MKQRATDQFQEERMIRPLNRLLKWVTKIVTRNISSMISFEGFINYFHLLLFGMIMKLLIMPGERAQKTTPRVLKDLMM